MTEPVGRALRGAPSLSRMKVSEKSSLIRDVDGLYVVTEQDVSGLMDFNHFMRGEKQRLDGTQRHRVHVAEIPTHLYMALRERFGPVKHNQEAWKRWLNDPDNRDFRTWGGTV